MTIQFDNTQLWTSPDEIQFTLRARPVSLQGSKDAKGALRRVVRELTRTCASIAMGDVRLEIEWLVHEDERYTSNQSPDVDNIIKPLLDAMSGPDGLMVNDCQVQAVTAYWLDTPPLATGFHQLNVRLRIEVDHLMPKAGLYWVECPDRLCFPLWSTIPSKSLSDMISIWDTSMAGEAELIAAGVPAHDARLLRPIQPRMHRSRLQEFRVVPLDEERSRVAGARPGPG